MFQRKFVVHVSNASEADEWIFGGEWFQAGSWLGERVSSIKQEAPLEFECTSWTQGISGYVWYQNADRSRTFLISLSCPLASACHFTARAVEKFEDCMQIWEHMPELPGVEAPYQKAGGCAFKTTALDSWSAEVRCVILPADLRHLPPDLQKQLEKATEAQPCLSVAGGGGMIVDRSVLLEIDNRSEETFALDGSWFDTGCWQGEPVVLLKPAVVSHLRFSMSSSFSGVCGLCWYVNESTHDRYVSLVFMHPLTDSSTFGAWVGPPPPELGNELYTAKAVPSDAGEVVPAQGCEWEIVESGCTLHIKVRISGELKALDLATYVGEVPGTEAVDERQCAETALALPGGADGDQASDEARFEHLMASTRPRHALDGLYSGVTTAGAGVLAGSAALVAMPIVGAQEDGATGFLTGVCKGALGFVGLTLGGVVAGSTQLIRGFVNTPDAISRAQEGKRWDTETGTWVIDGSNLRQEELLAKAYQAEPAESDPPTSGCPSSGPRRASVADTAYYDLLCVAPNAPPEEIKKAYYKVALRVHPDKNPDDLEAKHRFQELTHAYQVLSSPDLRAKYDEAGEVGIKNEEMPLIDSNLFFAMLFGSEQFEAYIGKLHLAMQTDHISKDVCKEARRRQKTEGVKNAGAAAGAAEPANSGIGEGGHTDDAGVERADEDGSPVNWPAVQKMNRSIKREQFVREVRLAVSLAKRLDTWVIGRDQRSFEAASTAEAQKLAQAAFGARLLQTIGAAYERSAEEFLAGLRGTFTMETQYASWAHSAHHARQKLSAISSLARSAYAVKSVYSGFEGAVKEEATEGAGVRKVQAELAQQVEENLPTFLQTAWDIAAMDIDSTLLSVCGKVVKDLSVPWQLRLRRARALLRLGQILQEVGAREEQDFSQPPAARQHVEGAFAAALSRGARGG